MKQLKNMLFMTALAILGFSCGKKQEVIPLDKHSIIPIPVSVAPEAGSFTLSSKTAIVLSSDPSQLEPVAEYLKSALGNLTGLNLSIGQEEKDNSIILSLDAGASPHEEGYSLSISDKKILIAAPAPEGLFYGIQTLKQLVPAHGGSSKGSGNQFLIPTGTVQDHPEYAYRGMMLDVARHFFSVEDVKKLIDQIAVYKINHLHLHLSDDQGWRIEIKSWPLLTTIGGANQVGGGEGGFYTQEDYKEIVRYAQSRFITIVPEIDMPGHTNSALNAYGILNPGITVPEKTAVPIDRKALGLEEDPKATPYHTGIEVGFSTFDTNNPVTYQFIDDVIREISEMTPGPYFHIGGDESHVTAMEDYIPFIEKAQAIVSKYGKKTLGWDEVAHAKLLPTSVAQYWAKAENAILAIEQGSQVLMSPAVKAYLDMQYDSTTHLGLHWAAYIELDQAYNWDPTELEAQIRRENILGVEAPLWTETIITFEDIEYMVFPRLAAIAEIAWSPKNARNWEDFRRRIVWHGQRWEAQGKNFYRSPKVEW
ncbi:beta-N-acetylhexosaminidase [Cecembia calidifontis]|jgi:hexosaminidase|uniref:beta-N-acetylhexosaminidase n=1 Tax=Cecembia calidifontis TaxID=1187080 RepID=A0A4Q7PAP8_9BACT|nr:beta-N-acetylhexosaminidase [Cecembia calidifontis]RZS97366.1 hexosaminidase [Cecembia calidifontis]